MIDNPLRRVVDDLPFELSEKPKDDKQNFLRLENGLYLCPDFGLDASIAIVDNDKVGNQTQGDDL